MMSGEHESYSSDKTRASDRSESSESSKSSKSTDAMASSASFGVNVTYVSTPPTFCLALLNNSKCSASIAGNVSKSNSETFAVRDRRAKPANATSKTLETEFGNSSSSGATCRYQRPVTNSETTRSRKRAHDPNTPGEFDVGGPSKSKERPSTSTSSTFRFEKSRFKEPDSDPSRASLADPSVSVRSNARSISLSSLSSGVRRAKKSEASRSSRLEGFFSFTPAKAPPSTRCPKDDGSRTSAGFENARAVPAPSSQWDPSASRVRCRVKLTFRRRARVSHRASTRTLASACVAHTTTTARGRLERNRALVRLRNSANTVDTSTRPPKTPKSPNADVAKLLSRGSASMTTGERCSPWPQRSLVTTAGAARRSARDCETTLFFEVCKKRISRDVATTENVHYFFGHWLPIHHGSRSRTTKANLSSWQFSYFRSSLVGRRSWARRSCLLALFKATLEARVPRARPNAARPPFVARASHDRERGFLARFLDVSRASLGSRRRPHASFAASPRATDHSTVASHTLVQDLRPTRNTRPWRRPQCRPSWCVAARRSRAFRARCSPPGSHATPPSPRPRLDVASPRTAPRGTRRLPSFATSPTGWHFFLRRRRRSVASFFTTRPQTTP